jgi:GAF domain-containing protein
MLSPITTPETRLETAARFVCTAFSMKPDEVALFRLDESGFLSFIWPTRLQNAGAVPLSATSPLVARTARENAGFLNNSFANTPHASFFEHFHKSEVNSLPIQKIMSAPLTDEGKVKGVIQVSRKGEEPARAGNDFSRSELAALERIAAIIAAYI